MIEEILPFIIQEWLLCSALVMCIIVLIVHEKSKGGRMLNPSQLVELLNTGEGLVVDLREQTEYQRSHILHSRNFPRTEIPKRLQELEPYQEKALVLVCALGHHSAGVARTLEKAGFLNVFRLRGGMTSWQSAQMPVAVAKRKKK